MVYLELGSCTYGVFGNCTSTFIVWALAQMVLPPFIRLSRGCEILGSRPTKCACIIIKENSITIKTKSCTLIAIIIIGEKKHV